VSRETPATTPELLPPGEAELAALRKLCAQRAEARLRAETDVLDQLRQRCPQHEIGREFANGVKHYAARARTDDAHPWYVVRPTIEGLARGLLRRGDDRSAR
jgi:hypothetical protein